MRWCLNDFHICCLYYMVFISVSMQLGLDSPGIILFLVPANLLLTYCHLIQLSVHARFKSSEMLGASSNLHLV